MNAEQLNALAAEIHTQNVAAGWWDKWPDKAARFGTAMMLAITELAEACEGDRKSLPDDHLPHWPMFFVELADTAIRLLDLAGGLEFDLSTVPGLADLSRQHMEGEAMTPAEQLYHACRAAGDMNRAKQVRTMLARVMGIAAMHKAPLWMIIAEKRAYNARRRDHTAEARAAANGKAY